MRRPASVAVLAGWLAGSVLVGAQVFRGGTDVVMLNVTVQDAQGRLVPGLSAADFQVFEGSAPQTLTNFSQELQPIALAILLDTSASMERRLETAQEAAIGFLRRLTPQDTAMIVDFDAQARIRQAFTNDRVALEGAIRSTRPGGPTALYNALYTAVNELRVDQTSARPDEQFRRQAIVVLSDGEDTASLIDDAAVLEALQRSEIALYAIGLRAEGRVDARGYERSEMILRRMAQQTGGRAWFVTRLDQLRDVYGQIADELASQYTLGYVSTNTLRDGSWRPVQVRTRVGGLVARTRAGYFAPKERR
ncbi:MAG TPA: VWA domain-containing protein [Vicinamibacterales bacterium]|nr:VWA domain-containing protein [Vicinamibacterales bacterium]